MKSPLAVLATAIALSSFAQPHAVAEPLHILAPADGTTVPLIREEQKEFLSLPREERRARFSDPEYRRKMHRTGWLPESVRLEWAGGGNCEVRLFRESDDTPVLATNVSALEGGSVTVDNLEIARKYRWSVRDTATGETASASFMTEDMAPRFLRAGALENFRDVGGRVGLGGRRVRQGMIYRNVAFNFNSEPVFYTLDEALAMPKERARVQHHIDEAEKWEAVTNNPSSINLLPSPLSGRWTLFMPECPRDKFNELIEPALRGLDGIPTEFLGASERTIDITNGEMRVFSDAPNANVPVIMMQEVSAPADGHFAMSAGGDYWWGVHSNGEAAFSLLFDGNQRAPYSATNYWFLIPVRKGRNLIAATVYPGWTLAWGWSADPSVTASQAAADTVAYQRWIIDAKLRIVKERLPGKERLDEATKEYLRNVMGIRTDIDLRSDNECFGMTGSPLGPSVNWVHVPFGQYDIMGHRWVTDAFKKIFPLFLDRRNYPIDIHCIGGADRTGSLAFVINGLLGVDEEELLRDWEATGFWQPNVGPFNHRSCTDGLFKSFSEYPGETINERIEAYVLSLGFSREDIDTLRSIMLE